MKIFFICDAFAPEIKSVPRKPGTECYRSHSPAFRNGAGRQRSKDNCASGKRKQHLMFEIGESIVRDQVPVSTQGRGIKAKYHPASVLRTVLPSVAQVSVSSGEAAQACQGWPASLDLTDYMRRDIELSRVVTVNRWTKFVGLLLIAVVLVIVIAPDLDLPATARFSGARQRISLSAFHAIIPASITLLWPNFLSSPVRVGLPGISDYSTNLIDLNCARLC